MEGAAVAVPFRLRFEWFLFSLRFYWKEVCFNAEHTWLMRRFLLSWRAFLNLSIKLAGLSIKLEIYQSNW